VQPFDGVSLTDAAVDKASARTVYSVRVAHGHRGRRRIGGRWRRG